MADWTASMKQTFEYHKVSPKTWGDIKKIDHIRTCTINRDLESETLGSATIDTDELLGECYIRTYLVVEQNRVTERFPLGTYLVQTPSSKFDGKVETTSMDAYTPLIELKENSPDLGYFIPKNEYIMEQAFQLTKSHLRAPVTPPYVDKNNTTDPNAKLQSNFVASSDDTWMSFLSDLTSSGGYIYSLDPYGKITFTKSEKLENMSPVWTYTDNNCSILQPSITLDYDLYGVPNVVEVIYSDGYKYLTSRVVNDDPTSPTSTVNRGRTITYRETSPNITNIDSGVTGQLQLNEYATKLLAELSTIQYSITYTHAYCPVQIGDCVRINITLPETGLLNVKAKVVSQSIKCEPGCPVTEKAVYTAKLWG